MVGQQDDHGIGPEYGFFQRIKNSADLLVGKRGGGEVTVDAFPDLSAFRNQWGPQFPVGPFPGDISDIAKVIGECWRQNNIARVSPGNPAEVLGRKVPR